MNTFFSPKCTIFTHHYTIMVGIVSQLHASQQLAAPSQTVLALSEYIGRRYFEDE